MTYALYLLDMSFPMSVSIQLDVRHMIRLEFRGRWINCHGLESKQLSDFRSCCDCRFAVNPQHMQVLRERAIGSRHPLHRHRGNRVQQAFDSPEHFQTFLVCANQSRDTQLVTISMPVRARSFQV